MGARNDVHASSRGSRDTLSALAHTVARYPRLVLEKSGRPDRGGDGPVATQEQKLQAAIKFLGDRWLLHPSNSPRKGKYNQWGKEE